ncbi:hypothetical protein [Shewanella decolorationis]|uniref:Uncharacterized protein n=2 Tax=Shewanella decolorationis TaxID=256839 RepID=A0A5B8R020_9GAMM|nr:hypothetical protein [Shewanella decolorationis]ESE40783.1 anti-sigma factor [Shewanella decolorationis S12]QDZ92034.1 hypothetical protein D0436_17115 [Shewanella decolorationis]GLR32285.1 hypothetical protein GCM10007922_18420 [Shewanella decolorationis]
MSNSTLSSEEEALRQEVSAWYHKQALEMPPERLDQDILRLSQARLAEMNVSQLKPVATPVWRRFPWALSSAASLVLVVGLVTLNRGYFEEELVAPAALTMSAPMPAQTQLDNAAQQAEMAHQAKVEEAATQNRQREVIKAQAKMSAQENQQAESRALRQIARALPQNEVAVAAAPHDKSVLMASLTRLQALIDSKQIQEALALEQRLVEQFPELSKSKTEIASEDLGAVEKFKALQQRLHQ